MKRPRVTKRQLAGPDHAVARVEGAGTYRREVCAECPWRLDAPIGAFPAEAYRISANTAYDASFEKFGCHMSGAGRPATCAGFLLQNAQHNLGVRLALSGERIDSSQLKRTVPLYASYRAMAIANGVEPDDPVLAPCRGNEE